jgi:hypothetical protein
VLTGLVGLFMSMVGFAAPIDSPAAAHPTPTADANGAASLKSPMPDLVSDKAYAAALTEDARIVRNLLAHPSADNLATAALFSRLTSNDSGPESPLELIRRATSQSPDRPELAWLELSICRRLNCDTAAQIARRIQTMDPGNGFLWIEELGRSTATGSAPEVTTLVQRIGAGSKITFYFNRLMVMTTDALAVGDPKLGLWERGSTASGLLTGTIIPPLRPVSKACRAEELTQEGRRAACHALMSRLEQSSEIISQMIALGIQARWWPADSSERAVLADKRRRLRYVMSESGRMRLFRLNHDMAMRLEAARRYDREEDVDLALIKSFGSPTEPPADWKDTFSHG